MALTCSPVGICSWDFIISGENFSAVTSLGIIGKSGSIAVNGRSYSVVSEGMFSSTWSLLEGEKLVATAAKRGVFSSSYLIESASKSIDVSNVRFFGNTTRIQGKGIEAIIKPQHYFTKRCTISGIWDAEHVLIFGFWLSTMMWRAAAGAGGAG